MITLDDYKQALRDLDAESALAADEIHRELVLSGLDEDQAARLMQRFYRRLDEIRARSVAELDKAFARVATLH